MDSEFRLLQKKLADAADQNTLYSTDTLVVWTRGCSVAAADAARLFIKLKDVVTVPTLVILTCSVTEYFVKLTSSSILKIKEDYPGYKVFITGCMDDNLAEKYSRFGTIIRKADMWDLNNYLI